MKSAKPSLEPSLGETLLDRGCRQGALLDAPARMLWLRTKDASQAKSDHWDVGDRTTDGQLVVVSQNCDLAAPAKIEPYVEVIAARWTSDASLLFVARKGNSARSFLLRDEGDHGLVADARERVQIEKEALLGATFSGILEADEQRAKFARWVASRYDRPAIANALVDAINKPIAKALDMALKKGLFPPSLKRIGELRFSLAKPDAPYRVHFIGLLENGDQLTVEEEAEFNGWLEDVLVSEQGDVEGILVAFRTPTSISLHDYERTTRLQLDHYSPDSD